LGAGLGVALGFWLLYGAGRELFRRAITPTRIFKLPARVWGMSLAHAGIGLFVLGAVVETSTRYEQTIALEAGQSATLAGWTLTLDGVQGVEGPNWYADRGVLTASKGSAKARLAPEKRYYPAAQMPTTETAIHKTVWGDLYAALGDARTHNGVTRWTFRVYFNPLVDFIFFGVLLMGLGGLLAAFGPKAKPLAAASQTAGDVTASDTSETKDDAPATEAETGAPADGSTA